MQNRGTEIQNSSFFNQRILYNLYVKPMCNIYIFKVSELNNSFITIEEISKSTDTQNIWDCAFV